MKWLDKISITPHIGAATLEAQDRIGTELARIIGQLNNDLDPKVKPHAKLPLQE